MTVSSGSNFLYVGEVLILSLLASLGGKTILDERSCYQLPIELLKKIPKVWMKFRIQYIFFVYPIGTHDDTHFFAEIKCATENMARLVVFTLLSLTKCSATSGKPFSCR